MLLSASVERFFVSRTRDLKKNDSSNQSKFLFNIYILKVCVSSAFGINFRPQEEVSEPVMLTLLKYLNNKHMID